LRMAAEQEAVVVLGTLWVVEQMVTHQIIDKGEALVAYDKMQQAGRRLPWLLARQRIAQL
jgi:hypothetical protein